MSYIGRGIDQIDNISTLDNLSFNGSDATFNLTQNSVAFVPVSADALQIQIDGVIQSGNYTVSGSTVTFDFTPSGSSVCNGIKHFGVGLLTTVSDGAVTEAKIGSGAVTSSKIASGVILSRSNANPLIINGSMDISQRYGTTATTITEGYSLDRWEFVEDTDGSATVGQTATVPTGKGFAKSLDVQVTGTDSSISASQDVRIVQKFEGQDLQVLKYGTSDAEKVTLSFHVKSSTTGTYSATLRHTNTSGTAYVNSLTFSISSANTWEQKVLVFNGNTAQDIRNTNTEGLRLEIYLAVGSNFTSGGGANANSWTTGNTNRASASNVNLMTSTDNDFFLTGVQMEVGEYTSATIPPFQHESYGDNLARCQRYYYKIATADGGYFGSGNIDGNNDAQIFVPFSVTMRTSPSAIETNGTASHYAIRTTFNTTCDVVPVYSNTDLDRALVIFKKTNHGITNGAAALARSQNNTAYLAWSAEL